MLSTDSGSEVVFRVHASDRAAEPGVHFDLGRNEPRRVFVFTVFRLNSIDRSGPPASRMFVAWASVDASGGLASAMGQEGAVASRRVSRGDYGLDFFVPYAHHSPLGGYLFPIVSLDSVEAGDKLIDVELAPLNGMVRLRVGLKRIHWVGSELHADRVDGALSISLIAARRFVMDLSIAPMNQPDAFRGDGLFSGTGVGQSLRFRRVTSRSRTVFHRVRNAGTRLGDVALVASPFERSVNARYFISGPTRFNATATLRTGRILSKNLRPGEYFAFEGVYRCRLVSAAARQRAVITHVEARDSRWNTKRVRTILFPE